MFEFCIYKQIYSAFRCKVKVQKLATILVTTRSYNSKKLAMINVTARYLTCFTLV